MYYLRSHMQNHPSPAQNESPQSAIEVLFAVCVQVQGESDRGGEVGIGTGGWRE